MRLKALFKKWINTSFEPAGLFIGAVSEQEKADFKEYTNHLTIFGVSVIALVLLIQDIVLWPMDILTYKSGSRILIAVWTLRLMVAFFCIFALLGINFIRIFRYRPVLFGIGVLTLGLVSVGWMFGRTVGLNSYLFYVIYSMPIAAILVIVPIYRRIILSTWIVVVYLLAFFAARPDLFTLQTAGPPIFWLIAVVSGVVVVGQVFYALLWSNFHRQHLLDLAAGERNMILAQQTNDIRDLVKELDSIEERERLNFAQEIHDELGQVLAGMRMEVDHLHMLTDSGDAGRIQGSFKRLNDFFNSLNDSIHFIIHKLRPGGLDKIGLVATIENSCAAFQARHGIKCKASIGIEEESLSGIPISDLYRIIQEALTNVAKHAKASMVAIDMSIDDDNLVLLTIRDDGQGFDTDAKKTGTFGLAGIRERVRQIGGSMEIESSKGMGTTIRVLFPAIPEAKQ